MDLNKIYHGDALELIEKDPHLYDLIVLHPPDLAETPYNLDEYKVFLYKIYRKCADKLNSKGNLVSITTDRKINGIIYTKHIDVIDILKDKLSLFNYKIWAKTLNMNLYILTYAHILAFRKGKHSTNNLIKEYRPDVLLIERDNIKGYKNKDSFPTALIDLIIRNYTNENGLVLDPFIGTGKTARICALNNRNYVGYEISKDNYNIANELIGETDENT